MNIAYKYKIILKRIVVLIILTVLAVITATLVFTLCYADKYRIPERLETVAVDGNGNAITDGQTMPERMAFVRTSASNSASVTVTATILPDDAMYSSPSWTLAWKDNGVTEDVTEFVSITVSSSSPLSATLTCNKVFTNKITLTFSVKDYYDKAFAKTCELDYLDRITGIDYITARYLSGADYSARSPLPYNTYRNTDPCEVDAFYYGSSSSVNYELGSIVLKHSGGTVQATEEQISFEHLRLQYSVSYNGGWISKTKDFDGNISPYIDFCEIIESLSEKRQILSASNNFPLVRVRFTFTNWTSSNNSFAMDFKCNYNTGISRVVLSKPSYEF